MDINQTRIITWTAPTHRTDGAPIVGTLSYLVEVVDSNNGVRQFPTTSTTMELNFSQEGYRPGDYTVYVRAVEEYGAQGRVSDRSNGFPLSLESVANPEAPTNLKVE